MSYTLINYVEFPAANLTATQLFFEKAFGWSFTSYGPEYIAFSDSGVEGGFFKSELSASTDNGSVLVVLYTKQLEDTLKTVEENGGAIVKPIFSFPGGRRFHFTEPSGNELAVWSDQ